MRGTGTFYAQLLLALVLAVAGTWAWIGHGRARDLGRGSDVLGYDAAQYAVAARQLAETGIAATPFALPVELTRHAKPPWPLALVQPGLLVGEALIFRVSGHLPPARLGWLVLIIPFACYLGAALTLAVGAFALLSRYPTLGGSVRWLAAFVVGLGFLLDPEAKHYATGGFTELPFTAGLAAAIVWLAGPRAPRPFRFGLLLGCVGLFRGNMLWLAPVLAVALAARYSEARPRVFARVLAGYALVLAPWWIYKWAAFGNPAWDLAALSLWDGVGGRSWFALNHLPSMPDVPHGMAAVLAIATKFARNLPAIALELASGPRTLWIAGLAITLLPAARPRTVGPPHDADAEERAADATAALAAKVILVLLAITLFVTTISVPLLRYLMPLRLIAEAAGLLAVWGYLWRLPDAWAPPALRRAMCVAIALLALGWGLWKSALGIAEATAAADQRGVPSSQAMAELAAQLDRDVPRGEPVMSNLGPVLAWYSRRPVVHLALTPADIESCRERLDTRRVVLVFRESARAWAGWDELLAHLEDAPHHVEWNVSRVRRTDLTGGFSVVWLDLGPLRAPMARRVR